MKVSILILAAGRGTRFGGPTPKVFLPCAGAPVLVHSVRRLAEIQPEAPMVLAIHPDDERSHLAPMRAEIEALGVGQIVAGGATRQESMQRALSAAAPRDRVVLIHDAARPLFSVDAARRAIARAAEMGAAVLATPCADTLKREADGLVATTIDRAGVWRALTPQAVRADVLDRALEHARATGFEGTDDVSLVEHLGQPVALVPDSPRNLKITTRDDLVVAAALLADERRAAP